MGKYFISQDSIYSKDNYFQSIFLKHEITAKFGFKRIAKTCF